MIKSLASFYYSDKDIKYLLMDNMKIAVIQLKSGSDKTDNINRVLALCETAINKQAKLLAFPEMFNYRNDPFDHNQCEDVPGFSLSPFLELAKNNAVWILAGSIAERVPNSNKCYNTSVLINNNGQIIAKYRKIHLFDVEIEDKVILESDYLIPGDTPVIADIEGVCTGLSICYDLRFPELYRYYSDNNAKILFIPSAFTKPTGEAHWEVLLRARAIENQCYVIAPNQAGLGPKEVLTYGNSLIIDPWGNILARGSDTEEEVLIADLDMQKLANIRKNIPCLKHRKTH
jgi:deaminated glutathione amidase